MSVHADLSNLNKVWEIKPLKMPGEDEARKILENVAKQVEPIMHKRRWKVTLLSEFCPSNPSLLGLNIGGGAEIRLRLRKHNRSWDFFPYESILDTMLHELCHNVYGPHNGDFYRLLDEIREELTELMIKGAGRKLGGSQPQSSLRQNSLGAAQKRAQLAGLMPGGPARVGGDVSIRAALSPAQAAAMAAERRLHDDLWCVTKSRRQQNNTGSSSTASQSTENVSPVVTWQCSTCTLTNQPTALVCEACDTPSELEKSGSASTLSHLMEPVMTWQCSGCTLTNRATDLVCEVCETPREKEDNGSISTPSHPTENVEPVVTWQCKACTLTNRAAALVCEACETPREEEKGSKFKRPWSCKFCTMKNNVKLDRCKVCGEWRYSTGPPVTGYTPFSNT